MAIHTILCTRQLVVNPIAASSTLVMNRRRQGGGGWCSDRSDFGLCVLQYPSSRQDISIMLILLLAVDGLLSCHDPCRNALFACGITL
jgi:hypothetical protein